MPNFTLLWPVISLLLRIGNLTPILSIIFAAWRIYFNSVSSAPSLLLTTNWMRPESWLSVRLASLLPYLLRTSLMKKADKLRVSLLSATTYSEALISTTLEANRAYKSFWILSFLQMRFISQISLEGTKDWLSSLILNLGRPVLGIHSLNLSQYFSAV